MGEAVGDDSGEKGLEKLLDYGEIWGSLRRTAETKFDFWDMLAVVSSIACGGCGAVGG